MNARERFYQIHDQLGPVGRARLQALADSYVPKTIADFEAFDYLYNVLYPWNLTDDGANLPIEEVSYTDPRLETDLEKAA